jgi:hypothetical protein
VDEAKIGKEWGIPLSSRYLNQGIITLDAYLRVVTKKQIGSIVELIHEDSSGYNFYWVLG